MRKKKKKKLPFTYYTKAQVLPCVIGATVAVYSRRRRRHRHRTGHDQQQQQHSLADINQQRLIRLVVGDLPTYFSTTSIGSFV